MRLLLDTQVLIWLASERNKLNAREKLAIAAADELLVSALSLMEIRIKTRAERRRGKSPSLMSPADAIDFCTARRIVVHPLAPDDLTVVLETDPSHGDPFDELMLAHAQALQATLLTRDKHLRGHPLAYRP